MIAVGITVATLMIVVVALTLQIVAIRKDIRREIQDVKDHIDRVLKRSKENR